MKHILQFQIECGAETCAAEPGKFCRYLIPGAAGDGTCYFFGEVYDKDGWIQRHPECMKIVAGLERADSLEQDARNILERVGVDNAQDFSAGDVAEIANLLNELAWLRESKP